MDQALGSYYTGQNVLYYLRSAQDPARVVGTPLYSSFGARFVLAVLKCSLSVAICYIYLQG